MAEYLKKLTDEFWSIRGEFQIAGVVNIGTHASLVRCSDDRFVMLDAYTLNEEIKAEVDRLTGGGAKLKAIINLHPFHTVHVEACHRQFPSAQLYGTERHLGKCPELPWQAETTESAEFAALFAEDFEFSLPAGVDFVPANENLHVSSVLAYHRPSKVIHVDDTLMVLSMPGALKRVLGSRVTFHPTLRMTLQKRPGAADEFRDWALTLAEQWGDAKHLRAAHIGALDESELAKKDFGKVVAKALKKVEGQLRRHKGRYG